MAEERAAQEDAAFDVGDTSRPLKGQDDGQPARKIPDKDPVTGRFISSKPENTSTPQGEAVAGEGTPPPPHSFHHPDWLVKQARALEFDDDEIAETSTRALSKAVHIAYRQAVNLQSQMLRERSIADAANARSVAPEPEDEYGGMDWGTDLEGKPLGPGDYAAPLKGLAKGRKEDRDELKALKAELAQLKQHIAVSHMSSQGQKIDAAFEALGEKYKKVFGDKTGDELYAAGAPEFKRRRAALIEAGVDLNTLALPAGFVKKLKEAADTLYGSVEEKPVAKEAYSQEPKPVARNKEWDSGGVAMPTNRNGGAEIPLGTERAVRNLERKVREEGYKGDSEIMDGLLG